MVLLLELKVEPLSVPASYNFNSTVNSSIQILSFYKFNESTPINQSGLGANILVKVIKEKFLFKLNSTIIDPGEFEIFPPLIISKTLSLLLLISSINPLFDPN